MSAADEARAEAERRMVEQRELVGLLVQEQQRFIEGFMQGAKWQASCDAVEVANLTAQLQAAQATIAEAKAAWFGPCQFDLAADGPKVTDTLSRADTSAYDAAIQAARVKVLEDAADAAGEAWVNGTWNLTMDTAEWLRARAAELRATGQEGQ